MFCNNMVSISLLLVIFLLNTVAGNNPTATEDVVKDQKVPINPIVKINEGEVRGKTLSSYSGRDIYTFLGIPYAQPPVGELRFANSNRVKPWNGVKDATRDGSICAQLLFPERTYAGDEDCLFINVFTTLLPEEPIADFNALHDVVVIIHGGGFSYGSGNVDAFMPDHLLEHDIVMVTFNYRLGVLGFLSTGDEWSPGNYGLRDQVEALSWVHRNIAQFGGNPMSITLLGVQAGGASAHYHMLAPLSADRFHKAISISGTALSPWALVDSTLAKQRTAKLGKIVGCKNKNAETSKALMKCLRKKYTLDLVTDAPKVMEWGTDYSAPFAPVVEPRLPNVRSFLPEHPIELMKKMKRGPDSRWEKPWLIGVSADDALPQALQAMVFPYIMNSLNSNPEKFVPLMLGLEVPDNTKRNELGQKIWDYYLGNETLTYSNLIKLSDIMSDFLLHHSVFKSIRTHRAVSQAPIYLYRYSYDPRENSISLGVPTGDDIEYMFPNVIAMTKRTYQPHERPVINNLIQMVANVAKYGNPTPEGSDLLGEESWPEAKGETIKFVEITKDLAIADDFFSERMEFWDKLEQQLKETLKHDEL